MLLNRGVEGLLRSQVSMSEVTLDSSNIKLEKPLAVDTH